MYVISTEKARRSQSAISFNVGKKHGQISKQRHRRYDPEILVSQAAKTAITNEGDNTNPNLLTVLTARPTRSHNTDALAIKLNRLHEKSAQCYSYKDFLSRSIQEKLVPKGLELNLEPTIGIYDQEFIDN